MLGFFTEFVTRLKIILTTVYLPNKVYHINYNSNPK